jgi:hypothetical protein
LESVSSLHLAALGVVEQDLAVLGLVVGEELQRLIFQHQVSPDL